MAFLLRIFTCLLLLAFRTKGKNLFSSDPSLEIFNRQPYNLQSTTNIHIYFLSPYFHLLVANIIYLPIRSLGSFYPRTTLGVQDVCAHVVNKAGVFPIKK